MRAELNRKVSFVISRNVCVVNLFSFLPKGDETPNLAVNESLNFTKFAHKFLRCNSRVEEKRGGGTGGFLCAQNGTDNFQENAFK